MIKSIDAFLRWFDGVNRRTLRDISALPPAAETWTPPTAAGETGWTVGQLVEHLAATRLFSVGAYLGQGWRATPWTLATVTTADWAATLQFSGAEVTRLLGSTPDEWLERPVAGQDPTRSIPGWRILINMAEHEVHHRSQIETYAGIAGWEVKQIFGIRAEDAGLVPGRPASRPEAAG